MSYYYCFNSLSSFSQSNQLIHKNSNGLTFKTYILAPSLLIWNVATGLDGSLWLWPSSGDSFWFLFTRLTDFPLFFLALLGIDLLALLLLDRHSSHATSSFCIGYFLVYVQAVMNCDPTIYVSLSGVANVFHCLQTLVEMGFSWTFVFLNCPQITILLISVSWAAGSHCSQLDFINYFFFQHWIFYFICYLFF
jgi:hypothetical protein